MSASRALLVWFVVGVLGGVSLLPASIQAQEERERDERREQVIEGTFIRHREVTRGENEFLTIQVRVPERGTATVIVPRRNEELMARARALKVGDMVRVEAVREGGEDGWWVRALRNDGQGERERDAERPRDGERDVERPRDGERERDAERPGDGERERDLERPRDDERERDEERPRDREREVDRDRETDREDRETDRERGRGGVIEGQFAMTTAVEIGDRLHKGLMIRVEHGDWLLVVVPRENDRLRERVRGLSSNDTVRIEFVMEDGYRWLGGIRVDD